MFDNINDVEVFVVCNGLGVISIVVLKGKKIGVLFVLMLYFYMFVVL